MKQVRCPRGQRDMLFKNHIFLCWPEKLSPNAAIHLLCVCLAGKKTLKKQENFKKASF